ncbi:MAG: DUF58 domain-containing protein [Campylobacterota bacterium]|nr:DUF58 domain-containing protein [Campylobacterota bacterium]
MNEKVSVTLNSLIKVGQNAKGFSYLPRGGVRSILSGKHASKLRGRGMDFLELKSYVKGDDVKAIDWRATRRTSKTQVRVYNQERDRAVYILLSQQSNMHFASRGYFKSVQAALLLSLSAHKILKSGDRIGGVIFNDEELVSFKPSKSKKNLMQMLQETVKYNHKLLEKKTAPNPEMLNKALDFVLVNAKHDDLIILIGDGSGVNESSTKKITRLTQHNDLIAAFIYDPLEVSLPKVGKLEFKNSQESLEINSSDEELNANYTKAHQKKMDDLAHLSLMHEIPLLKIRTDKEVLLQLQVQLGDIARRRR